MEKNLIYLFIILIILISFLLLIVLFLINKKLNASKRNEDAFSRMVQEQFRVLNEKYITESTRSIDRIETRFSQQIDNSIQFNHSLNTSFNNFQDQLSRKLEHQYNQISYTIDNQLVAIDKKVNLSLEEGFKKTNDTFTNIVARLSKIDEAQKNIAALSTDIVSLQDILTDKKTRGVYGEVQLNQILNSVFGKNDSLYALQYSLGSARPDAVVFAPNPLGIIAIDSKFPLENFRNMTDSQFDKNEQKKYEQLFLNDCKRHVDTINLKYIIPGVTGEHAMMFVPAEAIFATLTAYFPAIIEYAHSKHVWIVSPTTLISSLTTIQSIVMNLKREEYADVIQTELSKLNVEFDRYRRRWDNLSRHIDTVSQDVKEIHVTTEKITKRFDSISNVEKTKIGSGSIDISDN